MAGQCSPTNGLPKQGGTQRLELRAQTRGIKWHGLMLQCVGACKLVQFQTRIRSLSFLFPSSVRCDGGALLCNVHHCMAHGTIRSMYCTEYFVSPRNWPSPVPGLQCEACAAGEERKRGRTVKVRDGFIFKRLMACALESRVYARYGASAWNRVGSQRRHDELVRWQWEMGLGDDSQIDR